MIQIKKLPEKKLLQKNDFMRFRICIILKPRSVGVGKILIGNIFVEAVSAGFDATACSASMAAPGTVKLLEPQSFIVNLSGSLREREGDGVSQGSLCSPKTGSVWQNL